MTISTNMAGRGTDIKLGGPHEEEHDRVVALGGLYVIGTNRHESLRIDSQLRGRAGRQGDPGSSRFFISLEDDIFERYGLTRRLFSRYRLERGPIPSTTAPAQGDRPRPEGDRGPQPRHPPGALGIFDTGRDTATDRPGGGTRSSLPTGERPVRLPTGAGARCGRGRQAGAEIVERHVRRAALYHLDGAWTDHLAWLADLREGIHLVCLGRKEPLHGISEGRDRRLPRDRGRIGEAIDLNSPPSSPGRARSTSRRPGLKGPSSTWTYLVNEEQFGWGVELLKGTNIGFAAGAAAFYGPLFLLALIANRFKRKEKEGVKPKFI